MVDEDVGVGDLLEERRRAFGGAWVGDDRFYVGEAGDGFVEFFFAAAGDRDADAFSGEGFSDGQADA